MEVIGGFNLLFMKTTIWRELENGDEMEIEVEYEYSPGKPANLYGPWHEATEAEPGEIDIEGAFCGEEEVELTPDEVQKVFANAEEDFEYN